MKTPIQQERDFLSLYLLESDAYAQFEDLEKLVDRGQDLSVIPIQPLYLFVKDSSPAQVARILPGLAREQRQVLLDIDLWSKDQFSPEQFKFWLEAYSKVGADLKLEFVRSEEFALYLKGVFNISTFDVEEPSYPEHDHFFLTEDQQLIFEYDPQVASPHEVQSLFKLLYSKLGVEDAYAELFKLINASYAESSEALYAEKKERLREYGFVDYFDALRLTEIFVTSLQMEKFILSKTPTTGEIDPLGRNQVPFAKSLIAFKEGMSGIFMELAKIQNERRKDYLQFNFLRLVNGGLSLGNALQEGSMAMTKIGQETKTFLLLGLSKLEESLKGRELPEGVFSVFDFSEVYKIGRSLLSMLQTRIKKEVDKSFQDPESESFLGVQISNFLDNLFSVPPVFASDPQIKADPIDNMQTYQLAAHSGEMVIELMPFVRKFFDTYQHLSKRGLIQDHFYLNYSAQDLDFESIIISSFINFHLGHYLDPEKKKMGITIGELKNFMSKFFSYEKSPQGERKSRLRPMEESGLKSALSQFSQTYGLASVPGVEKYLAHLLAGHLEGYDFEAMEGEDFKHVGGPILLR